MARRTYEVCASFTHCRASGAFAKLALKKSRPSMQALPVVPERPRAAELLDRRTVFQFLNIDGASGVLTAAACDVRRLIGCAVLTGAGGDAARHAHRRPVCRARAADTRGAPPLERWKWH